MFGVPATGGCLQLLGVWLQKFTILTACVERIQEKPYSKITIGTPPHFGFASLGGSGVQIANPFAAPRVYICKSEASFKSLDPGNLQLFLSNTLVFWVC